MHRLSELAFTLDQGLPVVPSNELVAAYAGELLPDWYEDWVLPQRARWREARVHALESLAGASVRGGRFLLALVAARTAVAVEPFRETSRRALIEAYMSEGNQGQAAVEYRRYEALLAEEVGAAPSNELRALVMGGQRPLSKRSVAAS